MRAEPIVSVIVPVFNSASTLARALESALAQTLAEIEIIVLDDASTDASLAVARDIAARDARVSVIALAENGGKARAMNLAIRSARGRWVAVLDADDRYRPERLQTLVEAGESHGADLVADNQLHIDAASQTVFRQAFTAPGAGRAIGLAELMAHSDPAGGFDFGILKLMLRRDFIQDSGIEYAPEARFAEDFYYLIGAFLAGARGWLVHAPLYEWTLPFSPTARRWTSTGSGAWRYDYRNALATNGMVLDRLGPAAPPALRRLLERRAREYRAMIHYLDAQRAMAERRDWRRALHIVAAHPSIWRMLASRVTGRLARAARAHPGRA